MTKDLNPIANSVHLLSSLGLSHAASFSSAICLSLNLSSNSPSFSPIFTHARNLFSLHQYKHCSHLLEKQTDFPSRFLCLYSLYLDGERRMQIKEKRLKNKNLPKPNYEWAKEIVKEIETMNAFNDVTFQAFFSYLHALCLSHLNDKSKSLECLWSSVSAFPYNWSAWMAIGTLIHTPSEYSDALNSLAHMPTTTIFPRLFHAHLGTSLHIDLQTSLSIILELQQQIPSFPFLASLQAQCYYAVKDFETSTTLYQQLTTEYPYYLDHIDDYSNVLYVTENKTALAQLASHVIQISPNLPQTCIVLGNYYSLRGEHEHAIKEFTRATLLHPHYLSAWTLLGHEYIEVRNVNAAIYAYRKAVDIAPKDYRAWYGLGQTYDMMNMNNYSLYYYEKAAELKPEESRIWQAIGSCVEKTDKLDAIECYKRGIDDARVCLRVAELYGELWTESKKRDYLEASGYYYRVLIESEGLEEKSEEWIKVYTDYSRYCVQAGEYAKATEFLNILMSETIGKDQEEIRKLLRIVRQKTSK